MKNTMTRDKWNQTTVVSYFRVNNKQQILKGLIKNNNFKYLEFID